MKPANPAVSGSAPGQGGWQLPQATRHTPCLGNRLNPSADEECIAIVFFHAIAAIGDGPSLLQWCMCMMPEPPGECLDA